jgi:hypothetical protein
MPAPGAPGVTAGGPARRQCLSDQWRDTGDPRTYLGKEDGQEGAWGDRRARAQKPLAAARGAAYPLGVTP